MRYMIMMSTPSSAAENQPNEKGDWGIIEWAPEDLKNHIQFQRDFDGELRESGELVDAQGLAAPATAKIITCDGGDPVVSDGPFAETKEFLAGYWLIDVDSEQRAIEIAARASAAPGPGGKPLGIPIEIRAIGVAPEVD